MANAFFVRCDCRNRRFTGGKSRFLQEADGGKGIAIAADELCGSALTRRRSKKERSTQSRQMGRDRVSVISYFIMLLLKCRDFATVEATRGFPLAHRPLRRVLPCFLFFPAACLFLRQADSHRWTRWGIGAVAAAVGILPARAFRRIPANFLPLKQPASCHPPLGLRTAKSPSHRQNFINPLVKRIRV